MKLSMVVPVYREEQNITEFLSRIRPILDGITRDFEIIFAHDPSPDKTRELIISAHKDDPRIKLIEFSRRFGQPKSVLGGLHYATGEAVIVMDGDLQDPPEAIPEMVRKWKEGFDVVYGQRKSRKAENPIYHLITTVAYAVIKRIAEVDIPGNAGDFRLMSRRVVEEVLKLKESHGFLRGMVALVGFKQTAVHFDRPARHAGSGHYNRFTGSILIGVNGLVCFSRYPLTLATTFGFLITVLSLALALARIFTKIPMTLIAVLFLGGVQLLSIGILGEYIGRIYDEVKGRPHFIVAEKVGF